MYRVFKDGGTAPIIECHAYGSADRDGKLYFIADGAEIEVTEKMVVTTGGEDGNGTLEVCDVLEPNHLALERRQVADAAKEASEKAYAERKVAEKRGLQ